MDTLAQLYPQHLTTVLQRHDRALAATGYDHVLVFAGAQRMQFLDDNPYPFKVNPHFKAWVPVIDNPHCFVAYTPGEKPKLVYWQPVDYWYKPAETPRGWWTDYFDIRIIPNPDDAVQHFPRGEKIAFIGESDETHGGDANPQALLDALHWERSWKTDYEIQCVRQANVRGARGHAAALEAFRSGASEYEIHLTYLRAADHTEYELPYDNIIALNEHGSVLHYHGHDRDRFDPSQLHSFLIDAGASVNGYASDITRTYSARDDEFAELIEAMDAMQQSIVAAVKPGVHYPDLHMMAHQKVAEILRDFAFVKDVDADGIVEKRISSTFLPHGVGHFLGLQVHDVAGFMADPHGATIAKPEGHPYLRLTRKLEPRFVFTIEPGLYFIEPLLKELQSTENARYINWPKVDAFRKYGGVRVEDDVAVTADGHENLTRAAFGQV
jgi:Xaa-Pro dipeptidase